MRTKSSADAQRIRLLRFARAEIIRLSKASGGNFSKNLKRIDAGANSLKAQVSTRVITPRAVKAVLARFAAARRDTVRLQSSSKATSERTLKFIDAELKRLRKDL